MEDNYTLSSNLIQRTCKHPIWHGVPPRASVLVVKRNEIWLKTYSFWPVLITSRVEMAGQFWLTGCTHTHTHFYKNMFEATHLSNKTCQDVHRFLIRFFSLHICARRQRMKAEVKCQDLGTPEANASWHTFWDRYVEVIEALWTSWSTKLDVKLTKIV